MDAADDLYVDSGYHTSVNTEVVLKLPAGSTTPSVTPFPYYGIPIGVAVDAAGNVYVTDGER